MMGWERPFLQSAVNNCTNLSGQIEDCPLFDIQSSDDFSSCKIKLPDALAKEAVSTRYASPPPYPPPREENMLTPPQPCLHPRQPHDRQRPRLRRWCHSRRLNAHQQRRHNRLRPRPTNPLLHPRRLSRIERNLRPRCNLRHYQGLVLRLYTNCHRNPNRFRFSCW